MITENNKQRGNAGLSLAIAYFGANGYTVSLPINDTQNYDLIVDKDYNLERVQVKFTSYKQKGSYTVDLKSAGGTNGRIYKRVCDTEIEILFIVCGDKTMYCIPFEDIKHYRSSMSLNTKSEYIVTI